jgi:hypothetical protein
MATKQSLSYDVTLYLEFASARNHLLKIKFFLLPRNDAAVLSYSQAVIVLPLVLLKLVFNRHCEELQ